MDNIKEIKNYLRFLKKQPEGFVYNEKKDNKKLLEKLFHKYKECQSCPLATQGRAQVVFGKGNPNAALMFVGEGPGRDEDKLGEPFVGRAGKLLTSIIEAMGFKREDVWISNVVKCRPPKNRTPLPEESEKCSSLMLLKEIEIIKPQIICTLGAIATKAFLGQDTKISQARGNFHKYKNFTILPTYHPAYLLRNPAEKKTVWQDMQKILHRFKNSEL